jgi:hypothetical protein
MKPTDSDLYLLSVLNSVSLKTSELLRVVKATIKAHEEGKPHHVMGAIATIKNFSGNSNKVTAIVFRLQALAKMVEKNELRYWILANETGFSPTIAHRALISAAARHPLSFINGDFVFEKEPFLRSVLELAEPEGRMQ